MHVFSPKEPLQHLPSLWASLFNRVPSDCQVWLSRTLLNAPLGLKKEFRESLGHSWEPFASDTQVSAIRVSFFPGFMFFPENKGGELKRYPYSFHLSSHLPLLVLRSCAHLELPQHLAVSRRWFYSILKIRSFIFLIITHFFCCREFRKYKHKK